MLLSKNHTILTPHFYVIGTGSGGLTFEAGALHMKAIIIFIERGKMGGHRNNYGWVTSKALIYAAKYFYKNTRGEKFGCHAESAKVDFQNLYTHIQLLIA